MAAAAIAAAFPITALGLGSSTANALPTSPVAPGTTWSQDNGWWWGPGHGHGHGPGGWGPGWRGPGWGRGWGWGPGLSACVSATGPWGYVTGSVCILVHLSGACPNWPTPTVSWLYEASGGREIAPAPCTPECLLAPCPVRGGYTRITKHQA